MLESDWLTDVLGCAIIFMETHSELYKLATMALFVKKMNLKSHYRHCFRSLTHRGNINLSLSHKLVINCINCISMLSTAQASVTFKTMFWN